MDITQGTPDGAPLSPVAGDWVLAHDAASGRFARRFTFALPTGGLADGFRWQPDSGFTLSFPVFDYDAHAATTPESVTIVNSGSDSTGGVLITFPVPRTLWRVRVSGALSNDVIEAHRVDGDAVTDDAFAHAEHGAAGAILNAADRQLVLRLKRGGAAASLRAPDVAQVIVRSPAGNVRVGVALPTLGNDVFYLGPDAGAVLTNPTAATQLGPALATLLQTASDRLTGSLAGGLLPAPVPMILVLESDTPAQAHITGFVLRYRLFRRRFIDQAPKRLFNFAGGSLSTQPLTIDVPRGSALWSATLRMMGPFKEQDGGGAGQAGDGLDAAPAASALPASDLGVELHVGETAATQTTLTQAAVIAGATVELVALADTSAGRVRLHRDADGSPGDILGEQPFAPLLAGIRRIVRVDFENPTVLGAGPVWVAAQCDDGTLLWLTNTPGETTKGKRVLRRSAKDLEWVAVSAASDRGAAASLTTSGPDAPAGSPAFAGVRLFLGSTRLRGAMPAAGSAGERETRFDITAAVRPIVQSGTGSSVAVGLSLASSERGRVTVYPPEIEFDP
jgi:hypothetical protein